MDTIIKTKLYLINKILNIDYIFLDLYQNNNKYTKKFLSNTLTVIWQLIDKKKEIELSKQDLNILNYIYNFIIKNETEITNHIVISNHRTTFIKTLESLKKIIKNKKIK
jgi:hypothetical protein